MKILPSKESLVPGLIISLAAMFIVSRVPMLRKIVQGQ